MSFIVVIPARYQSTRLPAKPLADILGKTMVERVAIKALSSGASRVIVATDDQRIADALTTVDNIEVCMTSKNHESGTDRLAEVCEKYEFSDSDIIVNVQGDEPLIPASVIAQVANNLHGNSEASVATLSAPIIEPEEVFNPNAVKVVSDKNGLALYFSRATIPWDRDNFSIENQQSGCTEASYLQRHIGIYAYRVSFLKQYAQLSVSPLESIEKLEQLRVLWHGFKIDVQQAVEIPPAGVDTADDLHRVINYLKEHNEH
ncbi:3-deoxy-manno-octulosonate cytidylyltransferase [Psychromonas sp. psych-6C06]|uniref:3-deoxy-manno-octulosonate cytidylyltransferase n=1 Tax=Psychromonas sp. psych-6C06 TaxID=2058089 RepID=UPI000C32A8A8|nr:3-deoxy-manno-octulosonate cytidylyltransferase [Psychromonas sp. psych-6C06]PKF62582.1 3-deoxy-manno-octulosonate cytidylyltransferase [Psychromonas sp. psych-6C06]